ncbi:MAG TPA: N-acetylglucosamine-6-phosphate deacetylase, partial [Planctomicrobium sp.]|nr:N-acetylglucosamine-6-phosphate deacetylase [Planctomicrobium sp.]
MSGYVDLQINGYAGVDFNSERLQPDELHRCCRTLERDGVDGVLATVITDDVDVMCRRIARIVKLREQDNLARQIIWGIHVEGPFISPVPGFVGAHPVEHAQQATLDSMSQLLDAGDGLVRLVTLAPEMDSEQ